MHTTRVLSILTGPCPPRYDFSDRELHARSSFVLVKISKLKAKELEACEAGDCGLAYTMV